MTNPQLLARNSEDLQVYTRLVRQEFIPGATVRGTLMLAAGQQPQLITALSLFLITYYRHNGSTAPHVLASQTLVQNLALAAGETRAIAFTFKLPYTTPLSVGEQLIYLCTGLEADNPLEPIDADLLIVEPHPLMQKTFDALESLGFQRHGVAYTANQRVEWAEGFEQIFTFKATGRYQATIDELEVVFRLSEKGLDVWLEVSKRTWSYARLRAYLDLDERGAYFQVSDDNLARRDWSGFISRVIQRQAGIA
ncbi:MAG: sporulation protein [Chloroflexaceae bacterium]|jgi:sporulation-control protein|nr:sporulation protein [Chloroflexaceae bacterium]